MTLGEKVEAILLKTPQVAVKARDIAAMIVTAYQDDAKKKMSNSSWIKNEEDLISQYAAEIGRLTPALLKNREKVKILEGKPRRFYYSERTDEEEIEISENATKEISQDIPFEWEDEASMYDVALAFIRENPGMKAARINEKVSNYSKGKQNKWIHPDVVAVEDLTHSWTEDIRRCAAVASGKRFRLWSFEVKILLSGGNLKESFFQTLSNSSWANFSYLVVGELHRTCRDELEILSTYHGVGIILLPHPKIGEPEILIPAREKPDLDWNAINRLASVNSDFLNFMKDVRKLHKNSE